MLTYKKNLCHLMFCNRYDHLTTKTLMGFQWASTFCEGVDWVFKIDDDMFVNPYYIENVLSKLKVEHVV